MQWAATGGDDDESARAAAAPLPPVGGRVKRTAKAATGSAFAVTGLMILFTTSAVVQEGSPQPCSSVKRLKNSQLTARS